MMMSMRIEMCLMSDMFLNVMFHSSSHLPAISDLSVTFYTFRDCTGLFMNSN